MKTTAPIYRKWDREALCPPHKPTVPDLWTKTLRFGHLGLWRLCWRRVYSRRTNSLRLHFSSELVPSGRWLYSNGTKPLETPFSFMASFIILEGGLILAAQTRQLWPSILASSGILDGWTCPAAWTRQLSFVLQKHLRAFVHSGWLDMSRRLNPPEWKSFPFNSFILFSWFPKTYTTWHNKHTKYNTYFLH